jgi:hypothetical protein
MYSLSTDPVARRSFVVWSRTQPVCVCVRACACAWAFSRATCTKSINIFVGQPNWCSRERCDWTKSSENTRRRKASSELSGPPPNRPIKIQHKTKQSLCGINAVEIINCNNLTRSMEVDAVVVKRTRGGDEDGNYSLEVLQVALQKKGYELRRQKNKNHICGQPNLKSGHFLVLGYPKDYDHPSHYIACRGRFRWCGHRWNHEAHVPFGTWRDSAVFALWSEPHLGNRPCCLSVTSPSLFAQS